MTKEEYLEHVKNNELRNREPDIYDIEDAWVAGYNHAMEMAAAWMKEDKFVYEDRFIYDNEGNKLSKVNFDKFIEDFKKSMKL